MILSLPAFMPTRLNLQALIAALSILHEKLICYSGFTLVLLLPCVAGLVDELLLVVVLLVVCGATRKVNNHRISEYHILGINL